MEKKETTREQNFTQWVLDRREDKGFAAKLRRADNPNTEYYSLGILCSFGVNIENDNERLPYALIGAALCRTDVKCDGSLNLGAALRKTLETDDIDDNARLRRILACNSVVEICRVLRPVLMWLDSKESGISYAQLLGDIVKFNSEKSRERIKLKWTKEYYKNNKTDKDVEEK